MKVMGDFKQRNLVLSNQEMSGFEMIKNNLVPIMGITIAFLGLWWMKKNN